MKLPDLRKLRHVVVVAQAGSFTSASNLLAITQSALTKSIADVEHLLGMSLFERLPRGVRLTQAGRVLVERAERILTDANNLMADLDELSSLRTGYLRLGVAPAAFVTFLENTVSAFARVYPGVQIEVKTGSIDEMARELISGQLDVCIGTANYLGVWKELDIDTLTPLHHFFIGRKDHPASNMDPLNARDLLSYPVVLPAAGLSTEVQLANAYTAAGMSPRPAQYVCDHFPLVEKIVSATDAISPVVTLSESGRRLRDRFSIFENIIELDDHMLGIATEKSRQSTPTTSAFIEVFNSFLTRSELTFA